MAVYQISKIQIRRGKKNQGIGMPQLSSGEMAWAIDTQELYIGNGSVSEGAPFVGNTKILTEFDNIINIPGQYQYFYDSVIGESSFPGTVRRTLQNRLDEGVVNARNFGIIPFSEKPTGTDEDVFKSEQTTALQRASDALNVSELSAILAFDPGEYKFSSTVQLPNNTKIIGSGKDSTVLTVAFSGVGFTANSVSNMFFKDIGVQLSNDYSTGISIEDSKNCLFENVKFTFNGSSTVPLGTDGKIGVQFVNTGVLTNNRFHNVDFVSLTYAVKGCASFNSFSNCLFSNLYKGIVFENVGELTSDYNTISTSIFDEIVLEAIDVTGKGNKSSANTFKNVGADNSGTNFYTSVINFRTPNNSTVNDIFERELISQSLADNVYAPELNGSGLFSKQNPTQLQLPFSETYLTAIKMPVSGVNSINIDYVVNSTVYQSIRHGTISIIVDDTTGLIELVDDYEYAGLGGDSLSFFAELDISYNVPIIRIKYKNDPAFVNDNNEFSYTYTVLS